VFSVRNRPASAVIPVRDVAGVVSTAASGMSADPAETGSGNADHVTDELSSGGGEWN